MRHSIISVNFRVSDINKMSELREKVLLFLQPGSTSYLSPYAYTLSVASSCFEDYDLDQVVGWLQGLALPAAHVYSQEEDGEAWLTTIGPDGAVSKLLLKPFRKSLKTFCRAHGLKESYVEHGFDELDFLDSKHQLPHGVESVYREDEKPGLAQYFGRSVDE
jgi:hypothetical protein